MKAVVLAAVFAVAMYGCASEEVLSRSSRSATCWLGEVSGPDFGNVLSICTQNGTALLSNHFKNPGGIPTTCDSEGVAKTEENGLASFSFEPGMCENGRASGALALSCRGNRDRSLTCRFVPERNLVGEFRFTHFKSSKT